MRFTTGAGTGRSARTSSKPRAERDIINLQWQVYNVRLELVQAQLEIQRLRRRLEDVSMLIDVLQGNGILVDMMSDADQMVVKYVVSSVKEG